MGERVDAVDGGGDPGDEEGAEEEEGDAGVEPGVGVGFGEGVIARQGAHAEEFGGHGVGEFAVVWVGFGLRADFYVDGVGVETGVVGVVVAFETGNAHFFVFMVVERVLGGWGGGAGLPGF